MVIALDMPDSMNKRHMFYTMLLKSSHMSLFKGHGFILRLEQRWKEISGYLLSNVFLSTCWYYVGLWLLRHIGGVSEATES